MTDEKFKELLAMSQEDFYSLLSTSLPCDEEIREQYDPSESYAPILEPQIGQYADYLNLSDAALQVTPLCRLPSIP